jgi:hypothetical protein
MQRTAIWYFAGLLAFAIAAFWPSYFAAPPFKADFYHVHFHGVMMFAWFALLLTQATLVRTGRRPLHRAVGKLSYGLVPLIVVSTLLLAHYRAHLDPGAEDNIYFLYVQLSLIAFFTLCYAWAMGHRHEPMVHARYMAGTALAIADPIFARLFYFHLHVDPPMVQVMTYGMVIGLLGLLWVRERGQPRYAAAWRRMLVAYVLLEVPTFFVTQTAAWRGFVAAFGALPLP